MNFPFDHLTGLVNTQSQWGVILRTWCQSLGENTFCWAKVCSPSYALCHEREEILGENVEGPVCLCIIAGGHSSLCLYLKETGVFNWEVSYKSFASWFHKPPNILLFFPVWYRSLSFRHQYLLCLVTLSHFLCPSPGVYLYLNHGELSSFRLLFQLW